MKKTDLILAGLIIVLFGISGCARHTCAPSKNYHETWVQKDDSYRTSDACMMAIWDVGTCATDTPEVADVQITWALDCQAYCKKASTEQAIKPCAGTSINQDHGRPLCKRVATSSDMPMLEKPWYVICSDISSTCECDPVKSEKK